MEKASNKKLVGRALKCLLCDDVIISRHRHDYIQCKCGACFLDGGGEDYYRYGAPSLESIQWIDLPDTEKLEKAMADALSATARWLKIEEER